jgi:hypothetical protein
MDNSFNMDRDFASVKAKFSVYRELIQGVAQGRLRHLFVQGRPGLGKTHEAELELQACMQARRSRLVYTRHAGQVSPLALYNTLWTHRGQGSLVLLDDCDAAFEKEECLNILKAATDTRPIRQISWNSTSRLAKAKQFTYEGSVMVITNVDLTRLRYTALLDRVSYFHLDLTPPERLARIVEVLMSRPEHAHVRDRVVGWMIAHLPELQERLTIRTAVKALELAALNADSFERLANATLLHE